MRNIGNQAELMNLLKKEVQALKAFIMNGEIDGETRFFYPDITFRIDFGLAMEQEFEGIVQDFAEVCLKCDRHQKSVKHRNINSRIQYTMSSWLIIQRKIDICMPEL